jgi:hypothetical protein
MEYRSVEKRDRAEIDLMLRSTSEIEVQDALLSAAYYDPDWKWVQDLCLEFLDQNNAHIQSLAATCLGHIARIHRQLDLHIVLPRLLGLADDPQIGSYVRDALDDIKFYIKLQ